MKKIGVVFIIIAIALVATGFIVYRSLFSAKTTTNVVETNEEDVIENLPQVDSSIHVSVSKSTSKDNSVIMSVNGMAGKIQSVGYEMTYDSQGLIKGVNSGSKPIETVGKDGFEREIYLGTCSRNVCKPDTGVTKVSIVMEFTDSNGKRSQYTGDFSL